MRERCGVCACVCVCDCYHLTITLKVKGMKMGKRVSQITFSDCVQVEQTVRRVMTSKATGSAMLKARNDRRTICACYLIGTEPSCTLGDNVATVKTPLV